MDVLIEIISFIGRVIFRTILFEVIFYFVGLIILTPLYLFDIKRIHQKHSPEFISMTGILGVVIILLAIAIIV